MMVTCEQCESSNSLDHETIFESQTKEATTRWLLLIISVPQKILGSLNHELILASQRKFIHAMVDGIIFVSQKNC